MSKLLGIAIVLNCVLVVGAAAQEQRTNRGYVVQSPDGRPSTFITPTPGGGYITRSADGRAPTFTRPTPGGGYITQTPDGRAPTFIRPQ